LTALLFLPVAAFSSQRQNARTPENQPSESLLSSAYSDLYSDMPTLVRALVMPRTVPSGTRGSPRINNSDSSYYPTTYEVQVQPIQTKTEYINFLKDSVVGNKQDCTDRYNKYIAFFNHDSTLSGGITASKNAPSNTRLDVTCDFLNYSYWCFALGFAYATRDFEDPYRMSTGSRCLTYQEFCQSGKAPESFRIDEYLSRIIDEIMFYNTKIRDTNRNIVNTMVKNPSGGSTNGWKGYDTDSWVQERFPKEEMVKILCK
jgi:hypothetical protein